MANIWNGNNPALLNTEHIQCVQFNISGTHLGVCLFFYYGGNIYGTMGN